MQFKLSFNKPACAQFLADEGIKGIRVKVVEGVVMFKATKRESGKDTFPLQARTRGGMETMIRGEFAQQFLAQTGLSRGSHMTMEMTSYKWIVAKEFKEDTKTGKPSKIHPTARLWRPIDETATKDASAPKLAARPKAPRKSRTVKAASATATKRRAPGAGRRSKKAGENHASQ